MWLRFGRCMLGNGEFNAATAPRQTHCRDRQLWLVMERAEWLQDHLRQLQMNSIETLNHTQPRTHQFVRTIIVVTARRVAAVSRQNYTECRGRRTFGVDRASGERFG